MVKRIIGTALLGVSVAAFAATMAPELPQAPVASPQVAFPPRPAPAPSPMITDPLRLALAQWNSVRQTDSLPFSSYASFLLAHPGWPGESALRRTAERRIDPLSYSASEVVRYFTRYPPLTNAGKARYAEALAATGRPAEARAAARAAWLGGALSPDDETRMLAAFGSSFTQADQDQRMDRLLWDRATSAAQRQIVRVSPGSAGIFNARLLMQRNDPMAGMASDNPAAGRDAGWLADRALWLRDNTRSVEARSLLARPVTLDRTPLDPEKWLETLLLFARAASNDNQSSIAYDIAAKADSAFPAGTDIRTRSLSERDDYTSLVWIAGFSALEKLGRPSNAVAWFDRYARAAQSPQTQSRGWYWAGRAAQAAGEAMVANMHYGNAAVFVDQFYGQLAAERIQRPVAMPPEPPMVSITPIQRASFEQSEIVRAARLLGQMGQWQDQSQFVRTIAQNAKSDTDHVLADELGRSMGRPDLGVMVSRFARNSGARDPVRIGFPQLAVPASYEPMWVMIHAITRQESQFDRNATSRVGAKGLMQLMPGTAREQAGKLGMSYDYGRLTSDPSYNIMLGASFFQRMLDYYAGNHVLAVASYNAGPGNVNKWLRANGDPRISGVDVVDWIEAIPLSETRGYVQRVLENAVVYDMLHPQRAGMPAQNRLSAYLGKRVPG